MRLWHRGMGGAAVGAPRVPPVTCGRGLVPQPHVRRVLVLQAEPYALTNPAPQGDGGLQSLPQQAQQPPQGALQRRPGTDRGTAGSAVSRGPGPGLPALRALSW